MLEHALALAALGLRVHPLAPPNDPGKSPGKRPLLDKDWQHRATTDPATIQGWWSTQYRGANVGVACGSGSGVWVLDVDGPGGELALEPFDLPDTWEVRTRKGRHLYFRSTPEAAQIRNWQGLCGPGTLDTRGAGGQVVAPPSIHEEGHVYAWKIGPEDMPEGPAEAPPAFVAQLIAWGAPHGAPSTSEPIRRPQNYARAILTRACDQLSTMGEGGRNHALFNGVVGMLAFIEAQAISRDEVEQDLRGAALTAGLEPGEIDKTIASGFSKLPDLSTLGRIKSGEEPDTATTQPGILIESSLDRTLESIWACTTTLSGPDQIFRVPGGLGRVVNGKAERFTRDGLCTFLSRRFRVEKMTKADGPVSAVMPQDVRTLALADLDGHKGLPELRGIVDRPVFDGDRLIEGEGFDEGTGLLIRAADYPSIPEEPTPEQVRRALTYLLRLLEHFRWVGAFDQVNYLGAWLLVVTRGLYEGKAPGVVVDADAPDAGKSDLARAIGVVGTGSKGVAKQPKDEAEFEKRITGWVAENPRGVIVLDNIRGRLESEALEVLLTSEVWEGRILGTTNSFRAPHGLHVVITGNGMAMNRDTARRMVPVRITRQPDPDWKPPFLFLPRVITERRRVVTALLYLARAWVASGRPEAPVAQVRSFEESTRVVGSILAHAGLPGFMANHSAVMEEVTTVELPGPVEEVVQELEGRKVPAAVGHILERAQIPEGDERRKLKYGLLAEALRARKWRRADSQKHVHPWAKRFERARYWLPPDCVEPTFQK